MHNVQRAQECCFNSRLNQSCRIFPFVFLYSYEGEMVRGLYDGEGVAYFSGGHEYKVLVILIFQYNSFEHRDTIVAAI